MSPGARRVGWWALAVCIVLAGLGLRALIDGRTELAKATAAEAEDELDEAIMHYGRAARWRLPIAQHDDQALAALETIGRKGADGSDPTVAILAYRELRRALLSTRTPAGVSDPEALERANAEIARLMAGTDDPEREDRLAIQLSEPLDAPNGGTWSAAFFFVAWIGSIYGFFSRALSPEGHLLARPARLWGLAVLLCMLAWMLLTRHPEWISPIA